MKKVRPWCGQPSDRRRLTNKTEPTVRKAPRMKTDYQNLIILC